MIRGDDNDTSLLTAVALAAMLWALFEVLMILFWGK